MVFGGRKLTASISRKAIHMTSLVLLENEQEFQQFKEELEAAHLQELQQVQNALIQQQNQWEIEKTEELKKQHEILEEVSRRALETVKEEQERERRNMLSLQNKVVEFQNKVQELQCERRLQQQEQQVAQNTICGALREEQQREILCRRLDLQQDKERELDKLRLVLEQVKEENVKLRTKLTKTARREEEALAQAECQHRAWALDLVMQCQRIQELLPQTGATGSPTHLPYRSATNLHCKYV
ncbi:uncharacterized protein LOC136713060 [Amia ocellicauda]|uniref:uncharacterized protein LOC136713060 n=1 Tax=Amia ocellicauda TaxID=2972642 RepID=UPI003464DDC4